MPLDLDSFYGRTLPDIIAPNLRVLFCGINPSLMSAARGCHFARPGNRFWPALHQSGFTPRRLCPEENRELLKWGLGVTNLVARATRSAAELAPEEFRRGASRLESKCRRVRPRVVALLGLGAYRAGFGARRAKTGLQQQRLGASWLYVLPNPSGLNAHLTPQQFGEVFSDFRRFVEGLERAAD